MPTISGEPAKLDRSAPTIRCLSPLWIVCCLVLFVLLPSLCHWLIQRNVAQFHSVLVNTSQGEWYEPTVTDALYDIQARSQTGSIDTYLWNFKDTDVFVLIKGTSPCTLKVDDQPVLQKTGPAAQTASIHFRSGLSHLKMDVGSDVSKQKLPLQMFWSANYVNVEQPAADQFYNRPISSKTVVKDRIGSALGLIARASTVLIVLWMVLYLWNPNLSFLRSNKILMVAAFVILCSLRLAGIGYQMQEYLHPDEVMYGKMVAEIHAGKLAPSQFLYTTGFFRIASELESLAGWLLQKQVMQNYIQRLVSALASCLTCIVVFNIARKLFNDRIGVMSALFFGFSFVSVEVAHFGIVESTLLFFFLVALDRLVTLCEKPTLRHFAVAGFFMGVAVAIKQTAAIIVIPFFVTWIMIRSREELLRKRWTGIFVAAAAALLGFAILSPGTLLEFQRFYRYQRIESSSMEGRTDTRLFFLGQQTTFGIPALRSLYAGVGLPMMIAFIPGMFLCWKNWRRAFWFLIPTASAYFVLISKAAVFADHYVLLLAPFLAWLAAICVDWLASRFQSFEKPLLIGISVVLLFPSLWNVWHYERLLQGIDTRRKAEEWCYKNLPAGSRIYYETFGPRFLIPMFDSFQVSLFHRRSWGDLTKEPRIVYFAEDDVTSDVFNSSPNSFPKEIQWYAGLHKEGTLVKEFRGTKFRLLNPGIDIYRVNGK